MFGFCKKYDCSYTTGGGGDDDSMATRGGDGSERRGGADDRANLPLSRLSKYSAACNKAAMLMFVVVVGGGDERKKRDGDDRTTDGRGKYATNTREHTHEIGRREHRQFVVSRVV